MVQREIIEALRRVPGVVMTTLDIASHPTADQAAAAVSILRGRRCQMVVTVNEWGMDADGVMHEQFDSSKMIHVNWCVDDPFYEEIFMRKKFRPARLRIDFVSDRDYLIPMQNAGYNAHFLPLATDCNVFSPSKKPFERDCAFVGNSYLAQIDEFTKGAEPFLDSITPFLADCLKRYLSDSSTDIAEELSACLPGVILQHGIQAPKAAFIAKHVAGYLFRKQIVAALIRKVPSFTLYGDKGWERLFAGCSPEIIPYGEALRDIYTTTKINIDINRVVIRNGFTQRAFDTLACGSFVITSDKPIVGEFFNIEGPHREIVTFSSPDELVDKVRYYISHETERITIARNGMRRVTENHTYNNRMAELFRVLSMETGHAAD